MTLQVQLIHATQNQHTDSFNHRNEDNRQAHLQEQQWLQQYCELRENCFRNELGITDFKGDKDHFDESGSVLLLLADNQCIGGARLNHNGHDGNQPLPLEEQGFSLRSVFPQLNKQGLRYGQWTRLVLHPEFHRQKDFFTDFVAKALAKVQTTIQT